MSAAAELTAWDETQARIAVVECFGGIPDCVSFAGVGRQARVVFEVRKETPSYGGVPPRESARFAAYMREQLAAGRWSCF